MIGDVNPSETVLNDFRINDVIGRNVHLLATWCDLPRSTVSSITLANGTYEYTIASTTAKAVGLVLLNSTGDELGFVPWEQFNAYYKQDTAEARDAGTPQEYTLRESVTNVVTFRFGPTPNASDSAKVHLSVLPAELTSDATSIPFADDLRRGLELMCAAEIVAALDDDQLKRLGVSKAIVPVWTAALNRVVRDYHRRQANLGARQNRILRSGGRRVQVNA